MSVSEIAILGFVVGLCAIFPDRLNAAWPVILLYLVAMFVTLAIKDHRTQVKELNRSPSATE